MWILTVVCLAALGAAEKVSYEGFHLLTTGPFESTGGAQALYNFLYPHSRHGQVVFWTDLHGTQVLDFVVSPALTSDVLNYLNQHGVSYTVLTNNIQSWIDRGNEKSEAYLNGDAVKGTEPTDYLNYDETVTWMQNLASANSRVNLTTFGTSHEGRSMYLMTLGTGTGTNKPGVWIDCGIHAREWISPATCLWVTHRLATGYGSNTDSTWLLDNYNFYIAPVINPDGYAYTFAGDRMWRKTRTIHDDLEICIGVDANRNFPVGWDAPEGGNSEDVCSNNFRGPSPFSEPSMAAVRDQVTELKNNNNLRAFVTVHSFGLMWLHAWGYTADRANDHAEMQRVGDLTTNAIEGVHGTMFTAGQAQEIMYTAAGMSLDWAYSSSHMNIRYSYLPELRPFTSAEGGFVIPRENIQPSGQEIFAGFNAKLRDIISQP